MAPTLIKWPSGEYRQQVENGFNETGFPGTIGVVDGCYIKIPLPQKNDLAYICRKNFPSLILQIRK